MFRDDAQLAQAIGVLLSSVRLERLWTDEGPTPEAVDLCKRGGGPLSKGEGLILLAAFDLWNGEGNVTLGKLVEVDADPAEALWSLMLATSQGYEAIDTWIATTERKLAAHRAETPEQKLARFRARGEKQGGGDN